MDLGEKVQITGGSIPGTNFKLDGAIASIVGIEEDGRGPQWTRVHVELMSGSLDGQIIDVRPDQLAPYSGALPRAPKPWTPGNPHPKIRYTGATGSKPTPEPPPPPPPPPLDKVEGAKGSEPEPTPEPPPPPPDKIE
ncbi:MAG TPA: hypothetical protein VGZ23_20625 [bacterium]|nr:hypothetical protein [bacterium]